MADEIKPVDLFDGSLPMPKEHWRSSTYYPEGHPKHEEQQKAWNKLMMQEINDFFRSCEPTERLGFFAELMITFCLLCGVEYTNVSDCNCKK